MRLEMDADQATLKDNFWATVSSVWKINTEDFFNMCKYSWLLLINVIIIRSRQTMQNIWQGRKVWSFWGQSKWNHLIEEHLEPIDQLYKS